MARGAPKGKHNGTHIGWRTIRAFCTFATAMNLSTIPVVRLLIQQLLNYGVHHIIIAPGSRNAPITVGLTTHEAFKTYSIVDERSAGFFAIGLSQQLHKPVAVLCTSGSALLNIYPAVSEAYYSRYPLVVLSADRPIYQIDIGNGQTIRQSGVFSKHLISETSLLQDITHNRAAIIESNTQQLIDVQSTPQEVESQQKIIENNNTKYLQKVLSEMSSYQGPVHVNIPLEEPLYEFYDQNDFIVEQVKQPKNPQPKNFKSVQSKWNKSKRILVVVGTLSPDTLSSNSISVLAHDPRVIVLHEITSNLHHHNFIAHIDRVILPIEKEKNSQEIFQSLVPDLLITMGGMVVSKKIKSLLRSYKGVPHHHVGTDRALDTYYLGVRQLQIDPNSFFGNLNSLSDHKANYQSQWLQLSREREIAHDSFLAKAPFSDLLVFDKIMRAIPKNYLLQWANSSPIRYAQLFTVPTDSQSFCNRGTSGIEGSISTAVGAAVSSDRPTLTITGDLSFFYDANALWNQYIPANFRLIVVNNGGGGIFRILPNAKETPGFENYFETKHKRTAKHMAKQYGLSYQSVRTSISLRFALGRFFSKSTRGKILEISTPSTTNDLVLQSYFKFLSEHSD
jgi:2-succinyl-5-enolpyruvyl-6-hydroxy-3-cyclohexene-1-carboxylate synthase